MQEGRLSHRKGCCVCASAWKPFQVLILLPLGSHKVGLRRFSIHCCCFGWCRTVCGHSRYPCWDGDHHPAGCSPAERCRQRGAGAGSSRLVFLQGARHLRILALQPELSAAGPAQDANAVQNFPLTVGSGYYYTKQNKLRSLILVYLWIRL